MAKTDSESSLTKPLIEWLEQCRRIRDDSVLALELPWFGRRIDLVTLTSSGRTTAYELKLCNNRRALQQAKRNRQAFDRSYIVTATLPSPRNRQLAEDAGIGVILVSGGEHVVICAAPLGAQYRPLRKKLLPHIKQRAASCV